jgi:hypothetical protein
MPLFAGQGGAVFEIEPPAGGQAKEIFDAQLESGEITPVEPPADERPKPRKAAVVKDQ